MDSDLSESESTLSKKIMEMKHFKEEDICLLDKLTHQEFQSLVLNKIVALLGVKEHKFHHKRRNSVEVLPHDVKEYLRLNNLRTGKDSIVDMVRPPIWIFLFQKTFTLSICNLFSIKKLIEIGFKYHPEDH